MGDGIFCLQCGASACLHLQESHRTLLTPREIAIIRALCNPAAGNHKQIAFDLGLTYGTLKLYLSHVYRKLGWRFGACDRLVLFAMAHREQLGIPLPTAEQFQGEARRYGTGIVRH